MRTNTQEEVLSAYIGNAATASGGEPCMTA
jgi:hypothetical protein